MRNTLIFTVSALALVAALSTPAQADAYDYMVPATGVTVSDAHSAVQTAPSGNGATFTEVDLSAKLDADPIYARDWAASGMVVTPAARAAVPETVKVAGPGAAETELQKQTRKARENISIGAAGL